MECWNNPTEYVFPIVLAIRMIDEVKEVNQGRHGNNYKNSRKDVVDFLTKTAYNISEQGNLFDLSALLL